MSFSLSFPQDANEKGGQDASWEEEGGRWVEKHLKQKKKTQTDKYKAFSHHKFGFRFGLWMEAGDRAGGSRGSGDFENHK